MSDPRNEKSEWDELMLVAWKRRAAAMARADAVHAQTVADAHAHFAGTLEQLAGLDGTGEITEGATA